MASVWETGLDTSHWTYPTPWTLWKGRGYIFGYIKATEGTTWEDWRWEKHYEEAVGFYKGPYHYFRGQWNGALQAQHMFNRCGFKVWEMPPAIDVEKTNNLGINKAVFAARLRNCLIETENLWGKRPIIYTSRSMWHYLIGNTSWASAYDLWVAHYSSRAIVPLIPDDWKGNGYTIWQHTSRPMDLNRFSGTKEDFLKWIKVTPPPTDIPVYEVLKTGFYKVE